MPIVAKRSPISATAELLFYTSHYTSGKLLRKPLWLNCLKLNKVK